MFPDSYKLKSINIKSSNNILLNSKYMHFFSYFHDFYGMLETDNLEPKGDNFFKTQT